MNKILYLERIRNLREDSDYSQAEVAKILHVAQRTYSTYSDYERGNVRIPLDAMIQLAQLYKVSMDYICCLTDKK